MNLKTMGRTAFSLVLAATLAACNLPVTPTPLPEPTATPIPTEAAAEPGEIGAACVVGTWQISNLSEYLGQALPQMVAGATITPGETAGRLTYTFNADGTTLGQAEEFTLKVTVETNGLKVPGQIEANGSSRGQYSVDEAQGVISLTNVDPGDLSISASVAGIPVMQQTAITDVFMLGSGETGSGSTSYQCIDDGMQIQVDIPNVGARLVQLTRVQ